MANSFMNKLTQQLPVRIVNDWVKTTQVAMHCIDAVKTKSSFITKEYAYSEYGYHYEFGSAGTVSHITNGSAQWYAVTGSLIESTMRFLPQLVTDLADLTPTFASINFLVGNGAEHKDQVTQQTGFNYFFNTSNSTTYARNGAYEESYPSEANTGWLLDIQHPHRIDNTDQRIWFNLRFGKSFDYCQQWFSDAQILVYE